MMLDRQWFVLYVLVCLEIGLFLTLVPWSAIWERNYFLEAYPGLRPYMLAPTLRGAVCGLGLANIYLGIREVLNRWQASIKREEIEGGSPASIGGTIGSRPQKCGTCSRHLKIPNPTALRLGGPRAVSAKPKMDRIVSRSHVRTCMITGLAEREKLFQHIAHALESGVDWVQLRLKQASDRELENFVSSLLERHPVERAKFLVNDRFDVAIAAGLGGVHLPADGLSIAEVRRSAPPGLVIGASAHSVEEVRDAAQNGADFVFFGPVYPTASKPGHPGVGLERFAAASRAASIPVYALGGISPQRIDAVSEAGAAGVAAIALFEREASVRALFEKLA